MAATPEAGKGKVAPFQVRAERLEHRGAMQGLSPRRCPGYRQRSAIHTRLGHLFAILTLGRTRGGSVLRAEGETPRAPARIEVIRLDDDAAAAMAPIATATTAHAAYSRRFRNRMLRRIAGGLRRGMTPSARSWASCHCCRFRRDPYRPRIDQDTAAVRRNITMI